MGSTFTNTEMLRLDQYQRPDNKLNDAHKEKKT